MATGIFSKEPVPTSAKRGSMSPKWSHFHHNLPVKFERQIWEFENRPFSTSTLYFFVYFSPTAFRNRKINTLATGATKFK